MAVGSKIFGIENEVLLQKNVIRMSLLRSFLQTFSFPFFRRYSFLGEVDEKLSWLRPVPFRREGLNYFASMCPVQNGLFSGRRLSTFSGGVG